MPVDDDLAHEFGRLTAQDTGPNSGDGMSLTENISLEAIFVVGLLSILLMGAF